MSYIIKGILDRELPWGLVLLGVMIAIVLELCGVSSLAFAVGVYLPLATSAPIFVGGLVRWLGDRKLRAQLKDAKMSEEQLAAETDRSPGVMLSSGYIAGGAIAGIIIAISEGFLHPLMERFSNWAKAYNPFFDGSYSNVLSLLPFAVLIVLLYCHITTITGRPATPGGPADSVNKARGLT